MKDMKQMMAALEQAGVRVCGTTDEFYGEKNDNNGIWVAADYTPSLFNYWSESWGSSCRHSVESMTDSVHSSPAHRLVCSGFSFQDSRSW